jgi:hypothetical protein
MLLFVCSQASALGQEKQTQLLLGSLRLGQKGELKDTSGSIDYIYSLLVDRILSENEVLIKSRLMVNVPQSENFGKEVGTIQRAILKVPTKGLVDGARYDPKDTVFEVIDTKKIEEATYFVLRPVEKKK